MADTIGWIFVQLSLTMFHIFFSDRSQCHLLNIIIQYLHAENDCILRVILDQIKSE